MLKAIRSQTPLALILWVDVALELVIAALCFLLASQAAGWFGIETGSLYVVGVVFLVAAIAIVPLARNPQPGGVTPLAWANVIGGSAAWLVLVIAWGRFEPEGRWVLAAIADGFIAIGVAELFALRKMRGVG